ncbi:MAG TPA: hypothetical protein VEB59_15525, partial [Gemmatimonadales bacterium]|nr:hypothetical protein [Gemmatimonadales bacterium]
MHALESRRLTGPGLVLDRPGAVLDLVVSPDRRPAAESAWREEVHRLLEAVGWPDEQVRIREFGSGVSLGFTAPPDALYSAVELNEHAWSAAEARLEGNPVPPRDAAVAHLRELIAAERNPALLA